jgi:hypothetical protein
MYVFWLPLKALTTQFFKKLHALRGEIFFKRKENTQAY